MHLVWLETGGREGDAILAGSYLQPSHLSEYTAVNLVASTLGGLTVPGMKSYLAEIQPLNAACLA